MWLGQRWIRETADLLVQRRASIIAQALAEKLDKKEKGRLSAKSEQLAWTSELRLPQRKRNKVYSGRIECRVSPSVIKDKFQVAQNRQATTTSLGEVGKTMSR